MLRSSSSFLTPLAKNPQRIAPRTSFFTQHESKGGWMHLRKADTEEEVPTKTQ